MEQATKRQKIIWTTAGIILFAVLMYVAYRKIKNQKGYTDTGSFFTNGNTGTSAVVSNELAQRYNCKNTNEATFPLKQGSRGWQVEIVQRICNYLLLPPFDPISIDGIWGSNTEVAVQQTLNKTQITESDFYGLITVYGNKI